MRLFGLFSRVIDLTYVSNLFSLFPLLVIIFLQIVGGHGPFCFPSGTGQLRHTQKLNFLAKLDIF